MPARLHWPLQTDLRINHTSYRVYGRSSGCKLGPNQRDEAANITSIVQTGRNRITLQFSDSRPYIVMVNLARRQAAEGVKKMMQPPLSLAQAVAHVQQQIGGDEDIEVSNTVLSLRCPLTGSRIRTPARFAPVPGLAAFDLDAFLATAERTRKWQCPHSMNMCTVHTLQVCFSTILSPY